MATGIRPAGTASRPGSLQLALESESALHRLLNEPRKHRLGVKRPPGDLLAYERDPGADDASGADDGPG